MNALVAAVRGALERASLLSADASLLCGVSGGADSVALLHALCRLQPEIGFRLCAVHVQHGLRGEASLEDERFVRSLCRSLKVPLRVEALALHASMDDPGIETLARAERRRVFERQLRETGASAVLLAHHLDDQAETVLMHLLRGSGTAGLAGMRECVPFASGCLLRPFLGLPKQALLDALTREGLSHREDESNRQAGTPRNALRLSLLPAMEALYPGASARIAQTAERMAADEAFLASSARELFERCAYLEPPFCALRAEPLASAPSSLVRRALRMAYEHAAQPFAPEERSLSHADTCRLEALVCGAAGAAVNLPCNLCAVRTARFLHIAPYGAPPSPLAEPEQPVLPQHEGYAFRHAAFSQRAVLPGEAVPDTPRRAVLSPDVLSLRPVLRLPRPDDRICPLGAGGGKTLRRFFTDRKLDPFFRYHLPILAAGSEVLWIPSLCISERLRLSAVPDGSLCLMHLPKE